ncbi:hypothetical protein Pcar_2114 [Syntrophotalea carbinolica DSM 2380]|uniref:Lipoprotein n=1 Tax=Syntrophotalea carbinolica (strain DSM 2380 / NBRC 103641 / GraBd1) TaxID=338963 RepID=Q3A2Q3_SYNC1|nr:hypothetical protein Pcar_2114 [Syntrophotalea carbinolica DSM 2380]
MPRCRSFLCRLLAFCLACLWMIMPGGCASGPFGNDPALNLPAYDLHVRLQHQKIALLAYSGDQSRVLDLPVESRTGGALYGAGEGFVTVLGGFGGGSCEGAGCGVVVLFILGLAVVGGVVGAVTGAISAPSKQQFRHMDKTLFAALNNEMHKDLARKIEAESLADQRVDLRIVTATDPAHEHQAGYPAIRQLGYDSVLDLQITRIEFKGAAGKDPELILNLEVEARLVEFNGSAEPYQRTFTYASHPAPFSWWISGDGLKTQRALGNGITALARQIFQGIFIRFGPVRQ